MGRLGQVSRGGGWVSQIVDGADVEMLFLFAA